MAGGHYNMKNSVLKGHSFNKIGNAALEGLAWWTAAMSYQRSKASFQYLPEEK